MATVEAQIPLIPEGKKRIAQVGQVGKSPVGATPPIRDGRPAARPPRPNPFDDAEALEKLEKKITTLAGRIHAATHRLLTLIADFDRRRGWELGGHRSAAHWLSFKTGIDLGTAREKVRTARALVGLPRVSASMSRGELSFSQVRAVTRVATPANEGELLKEAQRSTTAELERKVRSFRRGSREDEVALERRRFESRTLSIFPDDDGMYVVRGRLPAEVGALLMRAVEAAGDALFRGAERPGRHHDIDARRAAAQRRADALGLLAERALAAGFGGLGEESGAAGAAEGRSRDGANGGADPRPRANAGPNPAIGVDPNPAIGADPNPDSGAGLGHTSKPNPGTAPGSSNGNGTHVPISGSRAERYQVVLHVESQTLMADGEPGRSELADGTRVSPETARRLSCDSGLVQVRHASDGSILDVGRKTRTIPPALRRALEFRDHGCRFPGCGARFAEGHHIRHWADGGTTSLSNCILLCRHHHRLLHEEGWTVRWRKKGQPEFLDPRGRAHSGGH